MTRFVGESNDLVLDRRTVSRPPTHECHRSTSATGAGSARITSCAASVVRVMPQRTCWPGQRAVIHENGSGGSIARPASRARPSRWSDHRAAAACPSSGAPAASPGGASGAGRPGDGRLADPTGGHLRSPMWIRPFRKVPVVSTTDLARMRQSVEPRPRQSPDSARRRSSRTSLDRRTGSASPCTRSWTARLYSARSACARGPRTAGPLRRFRTRNWIPPRSAARAMTPSRASISRTRWPLPEPADGGIAGHLADRVPPMGDQRRFARPSARRPSPPRCRRGHHRPR